MQSNLWILFCAIKIVNLNTKRKLDKAHCMEVEGGGIMRITRRQNTESIAHSSHYDRYPENNLRDIALPSDNDIGSRITFAEAYKANLISL